MPGNEWSGGEVSRAIADVKEALRLHGEKASKEWEYIRGKLDGLERDHKQDYIRKETFEARFRPIERLVYGMVALILAAFIGAIVTVVMKT